MRKLQMTAAAIALAAVSTASLADPIQGGFFVNGNVGRSDYRVDLANDFGIRTDKKDTAYAVRFGYTWHSAVDFGVEGGYADLGKISANYDSGTSHVAAKLRGAGWMLGANGKYRFNQNWYVAARGGWLRSRTKLSVSYSEPGYYESASERYSGNGWYGGVGVGYDFAPNFGVGLHYDNYRLKAKTDLGTLSGNVAMFSLGAEYRF